MTKKQRTITLIAIICGIISIIAVIRVFNKDKIKHISDILGVNVDNCEIVKDKDTHGGFLGDGDYFVKLSCDEKIDSEIKSKWEELPLSLELQKAMEMKWCIKDGCKTILERYNIPSTLNGYYYFLDRYRYSEEDNKDFNERSAYNFSVGIYDVDNKIIYFYELDT